jgi:hypothetical protein
MAISQPARDAINQPERQHHSTLVAIVSSFAMGTNSRRRADGHDALGRALTS